MDKEIEQWGKDHTDWREQANRESLLFCGIQLYEALKQGDWEAWRVWTSEIVSELGINEMPDNEK